MTLLKSSEFWRVGSHRRDVDLRDRNALGDAFGVSAGFVVAFGT